MENLKDAADGENYEWTTMQEFEEVARKEGFNEIADFFHEVGEVEEEHEKRFLKLLDNIKQGRVFKRDEPVEWRCLNCGYIHTAPRLPKPARPASILRPSMSFTGPIIKITTTI